MTKKQYFSEDNLPQEIKDLLQKISEAPNSLLINLKGIIEVELWCRILKNDEIKDKDIPKYVG